LRQTLSLTTNEELLIVSTYTPALLVSSWSFQFLSFLDSGPCTLFPV
jgi:hypothetical protein